MAYVIDRGACFSCGLCAFECPTQAISFSLAGGLSYAVDVDWCIDCGICAQVCIMACFSHRPELQPHADQLELAKRRARKLGRGHGLDLPGLDEASLDAARPGPTGQ